MIYILSVLELFNFEFCSIWIGHDILTINYFFHSYLYIQSNHIKSHKTIFEHETVSISDENISLIIVYYSKKKAEVSLTIEFLLSEGILQTIPSF